MYALFVLTLIATVLPYAVLSCNLTTFVGKNINISCHNEPVYRADWVYSRPSKRPNELEVCTDSACLPRFHADATKNFQLSVYLVNVNDTGTYTCITFDTREHRHPTEVCVNEPATLVQVPGPSTVNFEPRASLSTATTTTPSTYGWQIAVIVSVSVVVMVVLAAGIVVCLVFNKQTDGAKHDAVNGDTNVEGNHLMASDSESDSDSTSDSTTCDQEPDPLLIDETVLKDQLLEDLDKKLDEYQENSEVSKPEQRTEVVSDIDAVFATNEARALIVVFIVLFRLPCGGRNHSDPAKTAFDVLSKTSVQWWKLLRGRKQRVNRLLYYERSGYKRRPNRMLPKELIYPKHVMGIAILNGQLYTICMATDIVRVGSIGSKTICVKGMKYPVDIVACTSAEVLYIADEEQRCIWRLSTDGKSTKLEETGEFQPKSLSIRSDSLLVTTDSNALLKCYLCNTEPTEKIRLPEHIKPYHAVETSTNTFVVCCKRARGNQVIEVGSDGQELRQFVKAVQLMRSPKYLVMDHAGRLLVADFSNSNILLLDSKLTHCCAILDHPLDGIAAPQRLCLDENTGQLVVVQWASHSARVFDVKK